jgi:glycosyltransferase involved in cell wall biosynthesis
MSETVLASEVRLHNRLTRTLFNTRHCESVLREHGVINGRYIGHGFGRALPSSRIAAKQQALRSRSSIRFLHVGGHNPTTRKNTPLVLQAFIAAASLRSDIALTLTSMVEVSAFYRGAIPDAVTVIDRNLQRAEIAALYESHDVSIQVSSHEGLGLGFYEAIAHAVPVISLDAPPHNEPVQHGVTGWLIPARPQPLTDNVDGLVTAWEFEPANLVSLILALDRSEIERVIDTTAFMHAAQSDDLSFTRRLLPAIVDC